MTNTQSNTQTRDIVVPANASLVGKEGCLARLVNDSGVATAALPGATSDICPYVILEGADTGKPVLLRPMTAGGNVRIFIKGNASPAALVCPADGSDAGKIKAQPTSAGSYRPVGILEEAAQDGQLALVRPLALGLTVIAPSGP